ncbi:MAG: VTC domain-containing protein [Bianqueaceae bacterium]
MTFRHEWKHEINGSDIIALRQRLQAVARLDEHAVGGKYEIRSLYFDTPTDTVLRQKLDGVNIREKFRIRYYNGDTGIRLKRKQVGSLEINQRTSDRKRYRLWWTAIT